MKKGLSFLLAFIIFFGLSGCIFNRGNPYQGEYKELYTTAIYSIPNAAGYMDHGEGAYSSDIYIWEQDDYGRTLFAYCEDYSNEVFYLVISQAYDETNVYFYPDVNYVVTLIVSERLYEGVDDDHLKNKTEALYLECKEKLKEENDWNQPLDKTKCVSHPITDHKILGEVTTPLTSAQGKEILNAYTLTLNLPNPEESPYRYHNLLQVDAEGRVLYEIHGVHRRYDNPDWDKNDEYTSYGIILWVIADKNGNYDKEKGIMVMYSQADGPWAFTYDAKDVSEFKSQNNWVYSYCDQ